MSAFRVWLFRVLVAIAAVVMVISAARPWWTLDIRTDVGDYIVKVYQYGIPSWDPIYAVTSQLREYMTKDVTPFYQTVLAWIYLAASVVLALLSTWLKDRKGKWLLGGIGLVYIAYAAIAITWIYIRTGSLQYDIPLQGHTHWYEQGEVTVNAWTSIGRAHYLAYVAGAMFVILALLRDIITGKPKLEASLEASDE
jgi:MFS family permease